jgi:hypothetical protein
VIAGLRGHVDTGAFPVEVRCLWDVGKALIEEETLQRAAYLMMLNALLAVPGSIEQALKGVRDDLVKHDPALYLIAQQAMHDYITDDMVVKLLPWLAQQLKSNPAMRRDLTKYLEEAHTAA